SIVEAADRRNWRIGVLHGVDVRMATALKIPGHDALQRRDLGQAGQRLKAVGAIGLAEENPAAQFRGGEAPGGGQPALPDNLAEGGPGKSVVPGEPFQNRRDGGGQTLAAAPGVELVAFVVTFDQLRRTVAL